MMRRVIWLWALPLSAAITNLEVNGTTPTQAIISYAAPSDEPCTVEVSENPGYSPLVPDVNGSLFPGAGQDDRDENVSIGRRRTLIVGKRRTTLASDGRRYSRALQALTLHYFRITCGDDQATGAFITGNIPLGDTSAEPFYGHDDYDGRYAMPTLNGLARNGTFVDYATGALIKRITTPDDLRWGADYSSIGATCTYASGTNWTTPTAACNNSDGNASATYDGSNCGATCDWLALDNLHDYYNGHVLNSIKLILNASGSASAAADRTIEACISLDGTTCASDVKEVVLDQALSNKTICRNVPCDSTPVAIDTWLPIDENQIRLSDIDSRYWYFLVRKKTASSDTISIQYGYYDALVSSKIYTSYGGSDEICSPGLTASGYYICIGSGDNALLLSVHGVTGESHSLGYFRASEASHTPNVPGTDYNAAGNWLFDLNDPRVSYVSANDASGNTVLLKCSFTGDETVDASPGGLAPLSCTNLTPGANHLKALINTFDGDFDESKFSVIAVGRQNNYVILECKRGTQDSYGWSAVFDLGNGQPVGEGGTGSIIAAAPMWELSSARWSGMHSFVPAGDQNAIYYSTQNLGGTGTGHGPYQVKLSGAIDNSQTTIAVTSDAPDPNTGEPYSTSADNYLQDASTGDVFQFTDNGEYVLLNDKIRLDSTRVQWIVTRGYPDPINYPTGTPKAAHADQAVLKAIAAGSQDHGNTARAGNYRSWVWRFLGDPHGTDTTAEYTWGRDYRGHECTRLNKDVDSSYVSLYTGGTYALHDGYNNFDVTLSTNLCFEDQNLGGWAGYQGYPSLHNVYASTDEWEAHFANIHWFFGGESYHCGSQNSPPCGDPSTCDPNTPGDQSGHCPAVRVGGAGCGSTNTCSTYWYYSNHPDYFPLPKPKYFPLFGKAGSKGLHDISGPGSVIDDSKPYTFCYAHRAGECRPESTVGSIFVSVPALTYYGCSSWSASDVCIGNLGSESGGIVMKGYGTPNREGTCPGASYRGNAYTRTLTRIPIAWSARTAKALPNGKWYIFGMAWRERGDLFIAKYPYFPPKDTVRRDRFVKVPVELHPSPVPGVDNAVVEFGYDQNFYCTARPEACVKDSSPVESYVFAGDAIAGIPCANGCTVEIPALPHRVLYYRWKYLDSSNHEITSSSTAVTAVP